MDAPQAVPEKNNPKIPILPIAATAVSILGIVFFALALDRYEKYQKTESPQAQVRHYSRYLHVCIRRIDAKKAGEVLRYNDEDDLFTHIPGAPSFWNRLGLEKDGKGEEDKIIKLWIEIGVWREIIENCQSDLDRIRAEIVKIQSAVTGTIGEDPERMTPDSRRTLEALHLPHLTIEEQGLSYFIAENNFHLLVIPVCVGFGVLTAGVVGTFVVFSVKRLPPTSSARAFFPWSYPHVGWRRLSFVFAPAFAGFVCYARQHYNDQGEWTITALIAGAPTLLVLREIYLWVKRGFSQGKQDSAKTGSTP